MLSTNFDCEVRHRTETNSFLQCIGYISIIILTLAIATGGVAYVVFGIIYLVKYYEIENSCKNCHLWEYVLTAVVLTVLRTFSSKSKDESTDSNFAFCFIICLGLIEAGLATWGGIELWINSCHYLKESNLWNFALATFCLQSFFATLFLVIFPIFIIFYKK